MDANTQISLSSDDPVEVAADMLGAVREGNDPGIQAEALARWPIEDLADGLGNDLARVAFWSNVYNAATQRALMNDPELYEHRRKFFNTDLVTVAGRSLSLDDIEHHLIRRGYIKWSFGYIRWPFRSDYAERLSPAEREPRIHFALHCGAESCPMIRPYSRADIDLELDRATRAYLDQTVRYSETDGYVVLPKVFRGSAETLAVSGGSSTSWSGTNNCLQVLRPALRTANGTGRLPLGGSLERASQGMSKAIVPFLTRAMDSHDRHPPLFALCRK